MGRRRAVWEMTERRGHTQQRQTPRFRPVPALHRHRRDRGAGGRHGRRHRYVRETRQEACRDGPRALRESSWPRGTEGQITLPFRLNKCILENLGCGLAYKLTQPRKGFSKSHLWAWCLCPQLTTPMCCFWTSRAEWIKLTTNRSSLIKTLIFMMPNPWLPRICFFIPNFLKAKFLTCIYDSTV